MNENVKRWHDAYQKVLCHSHTDGVVQAFEKIVGKPPHPSDLEGCKIYHKLLEDLRQMADFEKKYPLAIVAFGGARLQEDDPYYELAAEIGEILAKRDYLVRTGAGPGIMDAVPLGYKRALSQEEHLTQGIRIELPFEQSVSPSIDVNTMMKTFAIRRTALIWNSRGIVVFPGGLGTVNELFEAWNGAIDHKVSCPIVVVPDDFYASFFGALEESGVSGRGTIPVSDFSLMERAKGVHEAIEMLMHPMRAKDPGTQFSLREKLIYLRHELGRGLTAVTNLPPAVVVMGSRNKGLTRTDADVNFLGTLVKELLQTTSVGIRLGVGGLIDEVVTSRAEQINKPAIGIQRILMTDEVTTMDSKHHHVDAHFESRVAHKETLIHNAKAAVFLPGDIPTMDVLFTLVCEIQTSRRCRIPVVLVGCEFWSPIVDGLKESLKGSYDGQFVNSSDFDIMTVVGTAEDDVKRVKELINA